MKKKLITLPLAAATARQAAEGRTPLPAMRQAPGDRRCAGAGEPAPTEQEKPPSRSQCSFIR
ncbi:MAG: hypothetical protein ACLVAW_09170 [Eisenbergiella massiliensis]